MSNDAITVAVIGASEEAVPVIRAMIGLDHIRMVGVSGDTANEPGFVTARSFGIKTYTDAVELVTVEGLDAVVFAAGTASAALKERIPPHIKQIDGMSARITAELAKERERLLRIESAYRISQKYARLLEHANKQLDDKILELSILNDVSKTFSASFDQRNIAGFVFSIIRKKLDFGIFSLLLVDESARDLVLVSDTVISPVVREEACTTIARSYADYTGEPLDPGDISIIEEKGHSVVQTGRQVGAAVRKIHTVPLTILDRHLGMLGIVFYDDYQLSLEDERFLSILAMQIGLFIENDRIKQTITNERNRLESILQNMTNAVLVVDEKGNIIVSNPMTEFYLGVETAAILGKPLHEVVPQKEVTALFDEIERRKGGFINKVTHITSLHDGIERVFRAHMVKLRNHLGQMSGTILLLNDITKEQEVDRMKTEFVSTVSHELRTPIVGIGGVITNILSGVIGEVNGQMKEYLHLAEKDIERLNKLIIDLLDYSKIEKGAMKFDVKKTDVCSNAKTAMRALEAQLRSKGIRLTADFSEDPLYCEADGDKITQVFLNLIHNALKFTPEGGEVRIGIHPSERKHMAEITVADTGIGIAKENMDKLFKRFSQIDRKDGGAGPKGTGLGLAITKGIVEGHKGAIRVESEPNKGTTFIFTLPRCGNA